MATKTSRKKTAVRPAAKTSKNGSHVGEAIDRREAYCVPATPDWEPSEKLRIKSAKNPIPRATLGDVGLAIEVKGPDKFPETLLIQPYEPRVLIGIDATTVRMFRWDETAQTLLPVWNSGNNVALGLAWVKIRSSGIYVALGLPRDRLLQEALQEMARARRLADNDSVEEREQITRRALGIIHQRVGGRPRRIAPIRYAGRNSDRPGAICRVRSPTRPRRSPAAVSAAARRDAQAIPRAARATGNAARRLARRSALFLPPQVMREGEPPWARPDIAWDGVDRRALDRLHIWQDPEIVIRIPPWLFSQDWWMYHHDEEHTGHASGSSNINSTNVGTLIRLCRVPMNGEVFSIPCIVDGKVYVGTGNKSGGGGSLCRIDLAACSTPGYTPDVLYSFTAQVGGGAGQGDGIGSSPAIAGNHAYFCSTDGRAFCWDINNNHLDWSTNLRYPRSPPKSAGQQSKRRMLDLAAGGKRKGLCRLRRRRARCVRLCILPQRQHGARDLAVLYQPVLHGC